LWLHDGVFFTRWERKDIKGAGLHGFILTAAFVGVRLLPLVGWAQKCRARGEKKKVQKGGGKVEDEEDGKFLLGGNIALVRTIDNSLKGGDFSKEFKRRERTKVRAKRKLGGVTRLFCQRGCLEGEEGTIRGSGSGPFKGQKNPEKSFDS